MQMHPLHPLATPMKQERTDHFDLKCWDLLNIVSERIYMQTLSAMYACLKLDYAVYVEYEGVVCACFHVSCLLFMF